MTELGDTSLTGSERLGFNRLNFIHKILEPDFNGSIRRCAEALGLRPNYLRDLIMNPERDAGAKTLTLIYRYCKKNRTRSYSFYFL